MKATQTKTTTILTPATEKKIFEKQIFPFLKNGDCLTGIWVSGGGKRKFLNYFLENARFFGLEKLGKYLIFFIDPAELTEESPQAYFALMMQNFPQSKKWLNRFPNPYSALKKRLRAT